MKKLITLLLINILVVQNGFSSHALGGELRYECLGNNQYKIYFYFFRDCGGVNAPPTAPVNIQSASCSQNFIDTLYLSPGVIEFNACPGELSNCNGGTFPGIQMYTYSRTITLPQSCNDWVVSYELCCRSNIVTNLVSPGNADIYINATINNTNQLCNNSPIVQTLSSQILCANVPYTYNPNAIDIDGDSLVFLSINPLSGQGQNIQYVSGFNTNNPLTTASGFVFDQNTGAMQFTPSAVQSPVLTTEIQEYRNGVLIGSSIRDVQLNIVACQSGIYPCPPNYLVWPGDANDDLVADNYDLLPLGLYFDTSGIARDSITNIWEGQFAINWNDTMFNGANMKHADCNGDGFINDDDTLAINLNYGLTHVRSGGINSRVGEPIFTLQPTQTIYLPGDTVKLDILIGDVANQVNNLYGVAFNISYNAAIAAAGSVDLFFNNSFIGNISTNLKLSKIFEQNGKADGAIVRKDQQAVSGYGKIGELRFVASSSISTLVTTNVSFTDYVAIDANGNVILFDVQPVSFQIDGVTGIGSNVTAQFFIYPNPANNLLNITTTLQGKKNIQYQIVNTLGAIAIASKATAKDFSIDISTLPSGIYFIHFQSGNEQTVKRFVKE